MEVNKKLYENYIKEITPVHNKWVNLLWAFLVGGLICVLGQAVINVLKGMGWRRRLPWPGISFF